LWECFFVGGNWSLKSIWRLSKIKRYFCEIHLTWWFTIAPPTGSFWNLLMENPFRRLSAWWYVMVRLTGTWWLFVVDYCLVGCHSGWLHDLFMPEVLNFLRWRVIYGLKDRWRKTWHWEELSLTTWQVIFLGRLWHWHWQWLWWREGAASQVWGQ
jgi:hypothetical protein